MKSNLKDTFNKLRYINTSNEGLKCSNAMRVFTDRAWIRPPFFNPYILLEPKAATGLKYFTKVC